MYQGESSLLLLKGIIETCYTLHFSSYNTNLEPIQPSEEDLFYHELLCIDKTLPSLLTVCETQNVPIIIGSPIELLWIAEGEKLNQHLHRIHIIGPMLSGKIALNVLKGKLEQIQLPVRSTKQILEKLQTLPYCSASGVTKIGQIMHYFITGDAISFSDFQYLGYIRPEENPSSFSLDDIHLHAENRIKEKRMIDMFQRGTLNYSEQMDLLDFQDFPGPLNHLKSLRSVKNTVITGITLYSRAAMDGGLPPEIGYTLADTYISQLEEAKNFSEVVTVNDLAMNDFIMHVNQYHKQSETSSIVRTCCEYIQLNLETPLDITDLAEHFGYSNYYLSRKFKAEMKVSLQEYIHRARIEYAKVLLLSSQIDIQSISERLHFCNPSYFTKIFKKYCGISPTDFRNQ